MSSPATEMSSTSGAVSSTEADHSRSDWITSPTASFLLLLGRVLMGAIFVQSGFGKLTGLDGFTNMLAQHGVPMPTIFAPIGAAVEFFGGLAIVLGVWTRYAAVLMILFVIVATAISHRYWEFADPTVRRMQEINFSKNLTIIGGFLFLIVANGGRYCVDRLWRRG